jgi:hypothetical protein
MRECVYGAVTWHCVTIVNVEEIKIWKEEILAFEKQHSPAKTLGGGGITGK